MAKSVAFFVSLVGTGGGHVLVGRRRRGLAFAAVGLACLPLARWTPLAIAAIPLVVVAAAVDAGVVAPRAGGKLRWGEWALFFAALHLALYGSRRLVLEAFKIPASGMAPTLHVGDHVFVDHLARDVERGDVIVFRYPVDRKFTFVKRVVGIGGDRVALRGAQLIVNGVAAPTAGERPCSYLDVDPGGTVTEHPTTCAEERLSGRTYAVMHTDSPRFNGDFVVPPGHVFVLGDNRENSHDSRSWGPVPVDDVLGTVLYVWWSHPPGGRDIAWHRIGRWVR